MAHIHWRGWFFATSNAIEPVPMVIVAPTQVNLARPDDAVQDLGIAGDETLHPGRGSAGIGWRHRF